MDDGAQASNQLTVVVAPLLGGAALAACIAAFRAQGARLLVVSETGASDAPADVEWLETAERRVPLRRLLGMRAAGTPLVAFVEDTCMPAPDWLGGVLRALADPDVGGVGGPIETSPALAPRFRALGLCEYARFRAGRMDRLWTGARTGAGRPGARALPGANFAFRRAALEPLRDAPDGLVDQHIFQTVAAGGSLMTVDAGMAATYARPHEQGARLATRFHHGRIYGASASAGRTFAGRIVAGLAAALAPVVLSWRTFAASPAWLWRSPSTVGWVIAMHASWGLGEMLGKATGHAGRSLEEWV